MTTVKKARSNYKALYLKKCRDDFSRTFWKQDLPIIIGVSLFIAVAMVCAAVPIANKIVRWFIN